MKSLLRLLRTMCHAEAQKPSWNCIGKFPDRLEKFPDGPESFWIVWIFSRWSKKFPNSLESFRIFRIFSIFHFLPPRRVQLADHGVNEAGEGAEVGLDGGIAKGEVGQGDDGVPAHLAATLAWPRVFHLRGQSIIINILLGCQFSLDLFWVYYFNWKCTFDFFLAQ